jgi:hypothetical protein
LTRIVLVCGRDEDGFDRVTANLAADGAWQLGVNGIVVARGSSPSAAAALRLPFVLRLDCTTDRVPSRASLFLNHVPMAEGSAADAFPMRTAGFQLRAPDAPADLTLQRLEVLRRT